jgi:membrane associated rhomboid family serine protease
MTPASVGFQCPECVAEGRRTQRSPRTAYGGILRTEAATTSIVLIAINVVVWLAINATGGQGSRLLAWLALSPRGRCDAADGSGFFPGAGHALCNLNPQAQWVPGVSDGAVWQLLTSTFTQVTLGHIFFNVLNLFILGPQLERVLGRARFLALYLLSGLAGSALVYAIGPADGSTIGASGAVFGLMGAFLVLAVRTRLDVPGMLVWLAISFAYSFAMPGISWQAHLGGFLGGSATAAVLILAPRSRRTAVQAGGLGLVLAVVVVTVVARTLVLT